eukprot:g15042.t1 g15042   contig21:430537-432225(+)
MPRFKLFKKRGNLLTAAPPSNIRIPTDTPTTSKKPPQSTKSGGLFAKTRKTPNGLQVTAAAASSSSNNNRHHVDDVSLMTPATGMPPDSPSHLRKLEMDLQPPAQQQNKTTAAATNLYSGTMRYSPSSPQKGRNLEISMNDIHDDDMSVVTHGTGIVGTPDNAKGGNISTNHDSKAAIVAGGVMKRLDFNGRSKKKYNPPTLLKLPGGSDTDDSKDLTVYEDGTVTSGVVSPLGGSNNSNNNLSSPQTSTFHSLRSLQIIKSKTSWLTQTKQFQRAIDASFAMVDEDKSGFVTLDELYAGLLLIHLKFAVYVGAPACRPASRAYVSDIFHLVDVDNSGSLSKDEFSTAIKILYSQVFTRIIIQWMLTLMIVPVISQYIIQYTQLSFHIAHEFWKDIDDNLDPIQRLLWKLWLLFLQFTPDWLDRIGCTCWTILSMVPLGVWKSLPLTMLTLVQTSIALPYALTRVEDYFRRVAHTRTTNDGEKIKSQ